MRGSCSKQRAKVAGLFLCLFFLGLPALSVNAQQQQNKTNSTAWAVSCKPSRQRMSMECQATQTQKRARTGELIISLAVRPAATSSSYEALIELPHLLDFTYGLKFTIDDSEPVSVPFQSSTRRGVFTLYTLHQDQFDAMKKGSQMEFMARRLNQELIAIKLSLSGFTAAMRVVAAGAQARQ